MDLSLRALNVRKLPAILNLAPESLYGEYVDGNDFTQKGVHMAEVSREKKKQMSLVTSLRKRNLPLKS